MPYLTQERISAQLLKVDWTESKKKPPNNIFKIDDVPSFQILEANGKLEKLLATFTQKFDIADHFCRTHRRNEKFDTANHRVALHEAH